MKRFFALLATVVALFVVGCASEERLVIVSTNDMHASIDAFPRLATLVEGLRREHGADRVLLIDAGDRWTGNPFVDLAEKPLSPIVELMNELGYDAATLGNHEFDWGQRLLRERTREMDFPVVCANVTSHGSTLGYIPPYAFIEAGGLRLALLGLVTNLSQFRRPEGRAENFEGLEFPDIYETADRYAWLRDSCDVFVGLTHIGDEADTLLARRLPSLDLILGGHTHTVLAEPVLVGKTLVTQTGSKLRYAGVTTITRRGKGGALTITNRLVALDTIPGMPWFERMVARYNANPELLAPIGEAATAFNRTAVVNFVADAVRTRVGADVALYHSGGMRIDTLAAGALSIADLFRIEPFNSEIYTLHLSAGQIKGLIISKFNDRHNPKEAHRIDLMPSGVGYTIVTDEAGEAVDVVFDGASGGASGRASGGVLGRPERREYLVAIPDYVYKNYHFDRPQGVTETGIFVTDALRRSITGVSGGASGETSDGASSAGSGASSSAGAIRPIVPDSTPRAAIK